MKKVLILSMMLLLFVVSYVVAGDIPEDEDEEVFNGSFVVPVGGEYIIHDNTTEFGIDYGVFGHVSTESSEGITFMLAEQEGYDVWNSTGATDWSYYSFVNKSDREIKYHIFEEHHYYLIFDNRNGTEAKSVDFELYIDRSGPSIIDSNMNDYIIYTGVKHLSCTIDDTHFDVSYSAILIDGEIVEEIDSILSLHIYDYSWNTRSYDNGLHEIEVLMRDVLGNERNEEFSLQVGNESVITPPFDPRSIPFVILMFGVIGIPMFLIIKVIMGALYPKERR